MSYPLFPGSRSQPLLGFILFPGIAESEKVLPFLHAFFPLRSHSYSSPDLCSTPLSSFRKPDILGVGAYTDSLHHYLILKILPPVSFSAGKRNEPLEDTLVEKHISLLWCSPEFCGKALTVARTRSCAPGKNKSWSDLVICE